ncbi:MAG: hypothetical protein ACI82F_004530 [Planctomycetota bacterium]|jgi:hypothetical protein
MHVLWPKVPKATELGVWAVKRPIKALMKALTQPDETDARKIADFVVQLEGRASRYQAAFDELMLSPWSLRTKRSTHIRLKVRRELWAQMHKDWRDNG